MTQKKKNFLFLLSYYYLSSRLLYEPQRSRFIKLGRKLLSLLLRNDRPQHLDSLLMSPKTMPTPPHRQLPEIPVQQDSKQPTEYGKGSFPTGELSSPCTEDEAGIP